jgi:peroxiredoxin
MTKKTAKITAINLFFALLTAFLLTAALFYYAQISVKNELLSVNDFRLESANGDRFYYSDYRDKKLLLVFYATWCGVCKYQIRDIDGFYRDGKIQNVFTVCIDPENSTDMINYLKNLNSKIPNLTDPEMKIMKKFELLTVPSVVILYKGTVIYKSDGYSERGIEKIIRVMTE